MLNLCIGPIYCIRFVNFYVIENQMQAWPDCHYGAVTLTCNTASCSVSFQEVNWLTFKYNIMYQGTLLCNYVYHFSTASVGAACASPGLRRLPLDPGKTILPNNKTQVNAWYAKVYMSCATTTSDEQQGCGCNITSQVTNSLAGDGPWKSASTPNGLNLGIGYNDALTMQDYYNYYSYFPHLGVCYLPPVAPPRRGCSPTWNYTGLNG